MKAFVCLFAIMSACNATFLNLLGDKVSGSGGVNHINYNNIAKPSHGGGHGLKGSPYYGHSYGHYNSHGHGGSTQVIKVILDQEQNVAHKGSGGYSYANAHSYGSSANGHGEEANIFKVITQRSSGISTPHVNHGYLAGSSHGGSSGPSYAPDYSYGDYSSQLNDILPQILAIILQHNGAYSSGGSSHGSSLNPQLVANFGRTGEAFITQSNGKINSLYSGGHVIEKGILKLRRIESTPVHSYPINGSPANVYSPHGLPVHSCTQHGHSW